MPLGPKVCAFPVDQNGSNAYLTPHVDLAYCKSSRPDFAGEFQARWTGGWWTAHAPGIGLAAIQVGEPLRVVTVDCAEREENERGEEAEEPKREPIFLINPEIVGVSDEPSIYDEGCLSIPDYYAEVERPARCTVNYLDRDGKQQTLEADGILATCIQHEIDHLNGVLFIDYISKLKRDMVIKKFTKIAKQNGTKFIG